MRDWALVVKLLQVEYGDEPIIIIADMNRMIFTYMILFSPTGSIRSR